jgi:nicotinamide-nucleotide amidase
MSTSPAVSTRPLRQVAIVSTGSEILQGLYPDTNAQWLAQQCTRLGLEVVSISAAPDTLEQLRTTLDQAASRCDLVISTGGLGPTEDDLNRWVFAELWNLELSENAEAIKRMEERFTVRGRIMPDSNRVQALLPRSGIALQNDHGTAPGFYVPATDEAPGLVALPGPPRELKPMFLQLVEPLLLPHLQGSVFARLKVLHLFGQPESTVNEAIREVFRWHPQVQVGILARNYGIDLRLAVRANTAAEADDLLLQTESRIRDLIPSTWIYGLDEDTLPSVVGHMLLQRRRTLATAESCTGGLVAKWMTDLPGSSQWFQEGAVTYSNEAKVRQLGVDPKLLETHGAVSEPVARAMAEGFLQVSGADAVLSVTGIAGPDGGTSDKPVGTVFVALARRHQPTTVELLKLVTDREMNRNLAAMAALNHLRLALLADPAP